MRTIEILLKLLKDSYLEYISDKFYEYGLCQTVIVMKSNNYITNKEVTKLIEYIYDQKNHPKMKIITGMRIWDRKDTSSRIQWINENLTRIDLKKD